MKREIWKYHLEPGKNLVLMPAKADILSVANQRDQIALWALVNLDNAMDARHIEVFPTGHEIPELPAIPRIAIRRFIGTVQIGAYVWHVFDRREVPDG